MAELTVLFLCPPASKFLEVLKPVPPGTKIVVGNTPEAFSKEALTQAKVVLFNGSLGPLLQKIYPDLPNVEWLHCLSAGLDAVLTPEMIQIPTPLTNSRGIYARSLSEFALAGMLYFAKTLNRMRDAQRAQKWEQFDIDELHGKVLGIVGYGEIGRRTAERAKPFGMQVHILRRRPELAAGDPLVDRVYGSDELDSLLAASDYLLVSAPLTAETRGLLGADGALTPAGEALRARVEEETDRLAAAPWQHLGEERTGDVVRIGTALTRTVMKAGAFPREGVFAR